MSETKQQLEDIAASLVSEVQSILCDDNVVGVDPAKILEILRAADQAIETANKLDS